MTRVTHCLQFNFYIIHTSAVMFVVLFKSCGMWWW